MRSVLISATVVTACLLAGTTASVAGPGCAAPLCGEPTCGLADCCEKCGDGCGCSWFRGRRGARYEGLDPAFNCGCNGSYKFPVPPLYTYHWPGMYSAQLMTDYHSPWRFRPLKPYVDEVPAVEVGTSERLTRGVRPVSLSLPLAERRSGEMEAMSSKLLRN
jgi:hypothetical protein